MNHAHHRQEAGPLSPPKRSPRQPDTNNIPPQQQQNQHPPEENKITPELLVDALSGHEDGLLSIAERLMTHYDAGYDAMGEAIIDAFADVQKLFQHVVEAAHMEGAALERERGEGEWRRRMEAAGVDAEGVLYGRLDGEGGLDGTMMTGIGSPSIEEDGNNSTRDSHDRSPNKNSEDHHRHEELIDQDVRDVLIDAIKRGQSHRDAQRFTECRSLYESACGSASALLPVDSDHRGRLQLAVARAESMSADRACAILKYAMDDVLRSGLSLRQGKYPQMDIKERSDCVLSRPNPLRSTPSRGYDVSSSWDLSHGYNSSASRGGDPSTSMVEQSAEEALNSLVEEMKEILAAPVYDTTPLQSVGEKFWLALGEAKRASAKKEERLEQALAKIKADFLLAREEYEEQLVAAQERAESLKRRYNDLRYNREGAGHHPSPSGADVDADSLNLLRTPSRPISAASRSSEGNHRADGHYSFAGMDDNANDSRSSSHGAARSGGKGSGSQSVVSLGSEFAQKAKGLVHLLNCQGKDPAPGDKGEAPKTKGYVSDDLNYRRDQRGSPR